MRWKKSLYLKLGESLYSACCQEANKKGIEHLTDDRIRQFVCKTVRGVGGKIITCYDHEVPYVMNKNSKKIASSIAIWNPVSDNSLILIPKNQAEKILVIGWP